MPHTRFSFRVKKVYLLSAIYRSIDLRQTGVKQAKWVPWAVDGRAGA